MPPPAHMLERDCSGRAMRALLDGAQVPPLLPSTTFAMLQRRQASARDH